MNETLEWTVRAILIGVGATLVMDLWSLVLARAFGMHAHNFAMLGRWIGHFPRGRFRHQSIAAAPPVRGEAAIGWIAHYAIGVAFAALLLAVAGIGWARSPTLLPALLLGVATVVAPYFIMQPGMGLGIAASRAPQPNVARARSLMMHAVFGIGLYLAGAALAAA